MNDADFFEVQLEILKTLWECRKCGVLVFDREAHAQIHETLALS